MTGLIWQGRLWSVIELPKWTLLLMYDQMEPNCDAWLDEPLTDEERRAFEEAEAGQTEAWE